MADTRTGTATFWIGTTGISASSFLVLAVLSHRGRAGELAAVAVVFALTFVTQVLPGAVQLRSAAAASAGVRLPRVPRRVLAVPTLALLALAPAAPYLLHTSAVAVALVGVTFPPALWLARGRGALIGEGRLTAAGVSCLVEACGRLAGGIAFGWAWGAPGVAFGLLAGTGLALAVTAAPRRVRGRAADTAAGSLTESLLVIGLLVLLVQIDVLVAPAILPAAAADRYAATASVAKGVFLALMAAGWATVADARALRGRAAVLRPPLRALVAGLAATGLLVAAFPVVTAVLGSTGGARGLAALLGTGMAFAAGTRVALTLAVVRAARRPWLAVVPSALGVAVVAATGAGITELAVGVLVAQVVAFAAAVTRLAAGTHPERGRTRGRAPARAPVPVRGR